MSLNITEIRTQAGYLLSDPLARRYTNDEKLVWANNTLDEIGVQAGFEKKTFKFVGRGYIETRNGARIYDLPADLIMIDKDEGVHINGLRYLPSTPAELDLFQEKATAGTTDEETNNADLEISTTDYFDASYTGLVQHYFVDYSDENSRSTGRSGKIIWFQPNPADSADGEVRYYFLSTQYTNSGSNTANIIRSLSEVLVRGVVFRASYKGFIGGYMNENQYIAAKREYMEKKAEVIQFYDDLSKVPDYQPRAKTARQAYGMYRTSRAAKGTYGFNVDY